MDAYLSSLVGALATWRATHLLHAETGPGRVFEQLREGQTVVFDAGRGDKGLRAENVRLS